MTQFIDCKIELLKTVDALLEVSDTFARLPETYGKPRALFASEEDIKDNAERTRTLRSNLANGYVKIAVSGYPNSGKSTVVNALLGQEILPSGPGHVTNCIIQLLGNDADVLTLTKKDTNTGQVTEEPLENINGIAHALISGRENNDVILCVLFPKERCPLLSKDITLVDMPGFSYNAQLDSCVQKECCDCDAFVLVQNAHTPLGEEIKTFVENMYRHFLKPKVFVIFNRWDDIVRDARGNVDIVAAIRLQYECRAQTLLHTLEKDRPNECPEPNFVFFTSALEALTQRVAEALPNVPEGVDQRLRSFEDFEDSLMQCASEVALKTKVMNHSVTTEQLKNELSSWLSATLEKVEQQIRNRTALEESRSVLAEYRRRLLNTVKTETEVACEQNLKKMVRSLVSFRCSISSEADVNRCKERVYIRMMNILVENQKIHEVKLKLESCLDETFQAVLRKIGECGGDFCLCSPEAPCGRGQGVVDGVCPEALTFGESFLRRQMLALSDLKLNYKDHVEAAKKFVANFQPDFSVGENFEFDREVLPLLPKEGMEEYWAHLSSASRQPLTEPDGIFVVRMFNRVSDGMFSLGQANIIKDERITKFFAVAKILGQVGEEAYSHYASRGNQSSAMKGILLVWHFVNFSVAKMRSRVTAAVVQDVVNTVDRLLLTTWEELDRKLEECLSPPDARDIDLDRLKDTVVRLQGDCYDIERQLQVFREKMEPIQ